MSFEIEEIERIVQAAKRNGLASVRIRTKNASLRIELPPNPTEWIATSSTSQQSTVAKPATTDIVVRSPMVGFFRLSEASAAEGDRVQSDTVIGSIEALGLPNEVTAGTVGILDELLVEDGQPVEYGQAIARIRP